MGDVEQSEVEQPQTPEQPAEAPETEQPLEEKPAEEGEAKPNEGEAEADEEGEETGAASADPAKPEARHGRVGGYKRKVERLERQLQERDALLNAMGRQLPNPQVAPVAAPDKSKDPAAQVQEYVSGLVKQQLDEERSRAKQAEVVGAFQRRFNEYGSANPDFEESVQDLNIHPQSPLGQVLLTSEQGPAIMHQLAKNPAELARLSALPPLDAAREVGRMEAKASGATPVAKPKSAVRPPAPPTSVGANKTTTRNLDDLPLADYKRAMRSGRR